MTLPRCDPLFRAALSARRQTVIIKRPHGVSQPFSPGRGSEPSLPSGWAAPAMLDAENTYKAGPAAEVPCRFTELEWNESLRLWKSARNSNG
jgi:hypothetical protein